MLETVDDLKIKLCETCAHARFDSEVIGSFVSGYWRCESSFAECRIGQEPYCNEKEECIECDGYKEVPLYDD